MEEGCDECNTWEQSIYWTHFHSLHFCQILSSDFRSQLMIPQKFSDNVRGKIQEKVTLKGPSGTTTWEVKLAAVDNMLFFRDGWTEFVNDYSLEENDILIFKYDGNSSFNILIFDHGNLCEKESSYFIKNCEHSKPSSDRTHQNKGFLKEILKEFTQEYSCEESELNPSREPRIDIDEPNPTSPEQLITSDILETSQRVAPDVPKMMSNMKAPCIDAEDVEETPKTQHKTWTWEPVKLTPVNEKQAKLVSINILSSVPKGRQVSQDQKAAAVRMAKKELTTASFYIVMRPTSVNRIFYLNMPKEWMNRYLTVENQTVSLRTNSNTWPTKLCCRPNGRAGLTAGWREFALDNGLEEFDVCLFKLANQKQEPVILDVSIFRAVPDAGKSRQMPTASPEKVV